MIHIRSDGSNSVKDHWKADNAIQQTIFIKKHMNSFNNYRHKFDALVKSPKCLEKSV